MEHKKLEKPHYGHRRIIRRVTLEGFLISGKLVISVEEGDDFWHIKKFRKANHFTQMHKRFVEIKRWKCMR